MMKLKKERRKTNKKTKTVSMIREHSKKSFDILIDMNMQGHS